MIQDVWPHVLRNEFVKDAEAAPESAVYCFKDGKVLIRERDGEVMLPKAADFPEEAEKVFLFRWDGEPRFLVGRDEEQGVPEGFHFMDMKSLRHTFKAPKDFVYTVWTALQLARWYRDNRYCGTCGTRTVFGTTERSLICPHCGRVIYPRIIPAVIVGVTNGDEIVLTKYAGRDIPYYALVAGFTEIGDRPPRGDGGSRAQGQKYPLLQVPALGDRG